MLNQDYEIDRDTFHRKGFAKAAGLVKLETIEHLRKLCETTNNDSSFVAFKKNKYSVGIDDPNVQPLLVEPVLAELITGLMGKSMIFTDGIVFELDSSNSGFDWHIGITSFKYIYPGNDAVSIWIPLDPVDTSAQDGGMSFVSKEVFNGREFYKLQHCATASLAEGRYTLDRGYTSMAGVNRYSGIEADCIESLRSAAQQLSPETYSESLYFSAFARNLLERESETFDFDLGDAVLFTKDVFHRSNNLRPGPMRSRRAFVLRFIDVDSAYDEINDRVMGGESAQIIKAIKVAHGEPFDISRAVCLRQRDELHDERIVAARKAGPTAESAMPRSVMQEMTHGG